MLNFEKYSKPSFEVFDESQSLDIFGGENNEVQAVLHNYKTYDYTLNDNNVFFIKNLTLGVEFGIIVVKGEERFSSI